MDFQWWVHKERIYENKTFVYCVLRKKKPFTPLGHCYPLTAKGVAGDGFISLHFFVQLKNIKSLQHKDVRNSATDKFNFNGIITKVMFYYGTSQLISYTARVIVKFNQPSDLNSGLP